MGAGNRWVDFSVGIHLWVGGAFFLSFLSFLKQEQCAILMGHVSQCHVPENQNVDKCSLSAGGTKGMLA